MSYEPVNCHPLSAVCLFINAVGAHLQGRKFSSSTLTRDLLPDNVRLIYKSALDDKTREDALPIIAYQVAGLKFTPYHAAHTFNAGDKATVAELQGAITFTISTTNEALTSELAFELGAFAMSLHKDMQEHNMGIQGVDVGAVTRSATGYYEAQVQIAASLGKPMWNREYTSSILREIRVKVSLV
jgi:hypothetical protein